MPLGSLPANIGNALPSYHAYILALIHFAKVHFVIPSEVELEDALPMLTDKIHEIGMANVLANENRLLRWIKKNTGHVYNGVAEPPFNPCPKCGRIHSPKP